MIDWVQLGSILILYIHVGVPRIIISISIFA